MFQLSPTPFLDGLIHLVAFAAKCTGLHYLLRIVGRDKFERSWIRIVVVAGAMALALHFGRPAVQEFMGKAPTSTIAMATGFLLAVPGLLLVRIVLKPDWIPALLATAALVAATVALDDAVPRLSAAILPAGPSFAEFSGMARARMDEAKSKDLKETKVDAGGIVHAGLSAVASLTQKEEMAAMKQDFSRGVDLFAERKAWMDGLTPEQRQAYRKEMSEFLAEQGLAGDPYSMDSMLAAVHSANMTNISVLASMLAGAGSSTNSIAATDPRSSAELLAAIVNNLSGFKPTAEDARTFQTVYALLSANEASEAIAQVREALARSDGQSAFDGSLLVALVQLRTGLPAQMIADGTATTMPAAPTNAVDTTATAARQPDDAVQVAQSAGMEPASHSPVLISIHLGSVFVPPDPVGMGDWIAAANELRIKGFASLGGETVILLENGETYRNGDVCRIVRNGVAYDFRVGETRNGKVVISAIERTNGVPR